MTSYHNPVHTLFGAGALAHLPALLAGRRAAVVTFPEAYAAGLVTRLEAALGGLPSCVVDDVQPNPDVAELAPVWERFWARTDRPEVVVALGGGSSIDTAKVLAVGTASGRFGDLVDALAAGQPFVPAHSLPLIAIPTTAGTGSEVTPWATVWDRARQKKYSLHLRETWPTHAIVDPGLMLSLPAVVTLQSGLDALSHALEAIWNVNANPISDTFAVAAVHGVLRALPAVLQAPQDVALRSDMALAALQAGLAFSNTRTALAHSISYAMTLRHGLPHGIACSFVLPLVLDSAIGRDPARDRVLAQALAPLGGTLAEAPRGLTAFIESLGVKTRFADYGVADDEAEAIVRDAQHGARGLNFIGRVAAAPPTAPAAR